MQDGIAGKIGYLIKYHRLNPETDKIVFTRNELYKLVWSTPLLTLSKKYNISDNGLRKICNRMNIPLPNAGHWMKLQFGKKVFVKNLPQKYEGDVEVTLGLKTENDEHTSRSQLKEFIYEIKKALGATLLVPDKLKKADKLIIAAKEQLANGSYQPYTYKNVVASKGDTLDIVIGKPNIKRGLLFFDTLIKSLKARGHKIFFKNWETYVDINSQEFKISLREKMKRVVIPGQSYPRHELHPTNVLCFRTEYFHQKEYKDAKERLEQKIPEIIAKLEIESAERTEEDKKREKARLQEEERRRLAQEYKLSQENDLADFKTLLSNAERWHKAENLRKYIDLVEETANKRSGLTDEMRAWLQWARSKADWYDPFINSNDELLANVDFALLTFKISQKEYKW